MHVVSIQVGRPREVESAGKLVSTAIYKQLVAGRVMLRTLNFDGDRQADLTVHGGPEKAVYAYPVEHYDYWRGELPGMDSMDLPHGVFGENLTVAGLSEETVRIGDRFRIGGAELTVTQPRVPCYKLGIRFGRDDMLKRFLASERTGWYFSVQREGEIGPGDAIERLSQDEHAVTVRDVVSLYARDKRNRDLLRRALAVPALAGVWRDYFAERLAALGG